MEDNTISVFSHCVVPLKQSICIEKLVVVNDIGNFIVDFVVFGVLPYCKIILLLITNTQPYKISCF